MAFELQDDGFVPVTIGGVRKELDIYRVNNRLIAFAAESQKEFPDPKDAAQETENYLGKVVGYLAELGFGEVSDRLADKFDDAVFRAVAELKKSDAPTPA